MSTAILPTDAPRGLGTYAARLWLLFKVVNRMDWK